MKTWLPTEPKGGGLSSGRTVTSHEKPSLSVGSSDQSLSPVVATGISAVATARQVRGSLGEAAGHGHDNCQPQMRNVMFCAM